MKTQIEKFKINGNVYTWTYRDNNQNYPGWNFTVDSKASSSLCELLELMKSCEWSTKKAISIVLPGEGQLSVPNNQNEIAKWKSKPNLVLNFNPSEPENYWIVRELGDRLEIQFGKTKLTEFQNAIKEVSKGNGDFAISDQDEENILYFWWNLENRREKHQVHNII